MVKSFFTLTVAAAAALGLAKAVLSDQVDEDADEIDLAVVAAHRRYRLRGRPLIEGRILVLAGSAELDLRRAIPGPTGIDLHYIVICGRLRIVGNADWKPHLLRTHGRHFLGRVAVDKRTAPSAVA